MPTVPSDRLAGIYDYRLVALSVLIAVLASFAALDLGGRVTASRGSVRSLWLMGGAAAMGIGRETQGQGPSRNSSHAATAMPTDIPPNRTPE